MTERADPLQDVQLSVSEFVALLNATLEYAYPSVTVTGELSNFRVSKNRWVYFDLKDEESSVKCFGTVYQLPGPLEDGMLLSVRAQPRLHQLYGFSLNVVSMRPTGEGTIRRAAELLERKLATEGLFDPERKRPLPYPPQRIGLIASSESAAYVDFMKILNARWVGINIELIDVQVQGEAAPAQIVAAIEQFNLLPEPPEVLVLTRGGGSADDLQAFSSEAVTRAVAASRVPTLVAIGHEIDVSLAELAADQRASTPSNAAELLVPDRRQVLAGVQSYRQELLRAVQDVLEDHRQLLHDAKSDMAVHVAHRLTNERALLESRRQLLSALSPAKIMARGFSIVRDARGRVIRDASKLARGDTIALQFAQGQARATIDGNKDERDYGEG